jgi:hypothetical protein
MLSFPRECIFGNGYFLLLLFLRILLQIRVKYIICKLGVNLKQWIILTWLKVQSCRKLSNLTFDSRGTDSRENHLLFVPNTFTFAFLPLDYLSNLVQHGKLPLFTNLLMNYYLITALTLLTFLRRPDYLSALAPASRLFPE